MNIDVECRSGIVTGVGGGAGRARCLGLAELAAGVPAVDFLEAAGRETEVPVRRRFGFVLPSGHGVRRRGVDGAWKSGIVTGVGGGAGRARCLGLAELAAGVPAVGFLETAGRETEVPVRAFGAASYCLPGGAAAR